jgi:transcriptional regulator with PAS, ATPase and Fis domain
MTTEGKPLKEFVEAFERMLIDNTMRRHKGSIVAVMEELCLRAARSTRRWPSTT